MIQWRPAHYRNYSFARSLPLTCTRIEAIVHLPNLKHPGGPSAIPFQQQPRRLGQKYRRDALHFPFSESPSDARSGMWMVTCRNQCGVHWRPPTLDGQQCEQTWARVRIYPWISGNFWPGTYPAKFCWVGTRPKVISRVPDISLEFGLLNWVIIKLYNLIT
jgi:hypothetical protein